MKKTDYSRSRSLIDRSVLAGGLMSAAALAIAPITPDAATLGSVYFPALASPSATSSLLASVTGEGATEVKPLELPPDLLDKWSEAEQIRFRELAIEEAVGELPPEELVELEQLTALRRAFEHPRSGDEILWEFEQRRRTRDLLQTLRRYVEFYEGADPAWSAARKSSN
jgi:hypothetical protein